jgi:hypothetical protein
MTCRWCLARRAAMARSDLSYTVRVWCDENGAEGEYRIKKSPSRIDAIEDAVRLFQESCGMAGTFYQPPRHRCQTEVIGVHA